MMPELRSQSRPGHVLRPVSQHPALHAAGKAMWQKGIDLWPGRYDGQRELNAGYEYPANTGFGSVTFAASPATYALSGVFTKTCSGHTDHNNAFESMQPTNVYVVDIDPPPGASGVIKSENDPRWIEYFKNNPDGTPRTNGLGRNVMHEGPGPDSLEAGRFLPMGTIYGDPSSQWHWAEGLVTTCHCNGVPVSRSFKRSRFMRVVIIPRLSGRSTAALCINSPLAPSPLAPPTRPSPLAIAESCACRAGQRPHSPSSALEGSSSGNPSSAGCTRTTSGHTVDGGAPRDGRSRLCGIGSWTRPPSGRVRILRRRSSR